MIQNESKYKVGIIIPVYNAELYLRDCLNSIINQTYTDWTCVIVNDGSVDQSQHIIEEYCSKDSRFKFYIKKNERSAAKAREYAVKRIESEWLMFVDADDAIEPKCVQKLLQRQQETNADMVIGRRIGCSNGIYGESWRIPCESFDMNQILSGREACLYTIGGWQIGGVVLSKKALDNELKAGPYMNSDELLERQRLLSAKTVAFVDAHYYFRHNIGTSDRISVRMFDRTLVDMQLEHLVYDNFPERKDKIIALTWQRFFNLIYLCADFKIHIDEFSEEERNHAISILKYSYQAMDKLRTYRYFLFHSLLLFSFSFRIFMLKSMLYVKYKRSHGGAFYYR